MSEDIKPTMGPGTHIHSLIENDMKESYLRYSMSVIISRALPDVRDGLKPVHRRALFGMHDLGVYPGKPYKKSARIVGDVIGKYHPHGDAAVYSTIVRMAQDFSLRYPLVDGQGNFGSVDGDSPAAMRYTEARMNRYAAMMLEDLEKDTVDYIPNYDESLQEPTVLPSAFPNLIVNGSTGIAVGMATNMAPHNLKEVIAAIKAYIENPDISPDDLLQYVSGPDFPTGGIIHGSAGIRSAYLTGRGKVKVRARSEIQEFKNGRQRIIVSEIPYMVNKAGLLEKTAQLVRDKKIEGISDLRDESDRSGMRIVIELKKDAIADVVLNNLYKYTQLQDVFSIYNLALVNKQPMLLNLLDLVRHYVDHRHEIVVRRTEFELKKAKARAHILEGLRIAIQNIDEVIRIIRGSENTEGAKLTLQERFELSEIQAGAIVEMRLRALTGLEIDKVEKEYAELILAITDYEDILAKKERRMQIVLDRLTEISDKYGDDRRTSIEEASEDFDIEDLIPEEEQVITLSNTGYIKRVPLGSFRSQGRGGRGVSGATLKSEDFVTTMFVASTHDYLLIFTNQGRVHWTKAYRIPESSRTGRGKAIINLIELNETEEVSAIVPVREFTAGHHIMMVTRKGTINKMDVGLFSRPRRGGVNALTLDSDDSLIQVLLATDDSNVLIASRKGQAICFPPSAFRSMGRGTRGVRGIRLAESDYVIGMILLKEGAKVLTVTENGYGKRTEPGEYRVTNRGGKGIRNLRVTEKNGEAIAIASIEDDYDLMVTTRNGVVIRTSVQSIRVIGRDSQGVRAINLRDGDAVTDVTCLPSEGDEELTDAIIPEDIIEEDLLPEEDYPEEEIEEEIEDELEEDPTDEK
jgi:DNA gyrase subunit A